MCVDSQLVELASSSQTLVRDIEDRHGLTRQTTIETLSIHLTLGLTQDQVRFHTNHTCNEMEIWNLK